MYGLETQNVTGTGRQVILPCLGRESLCYSACLVILTQRFSCLADRCFPEVYHATCTDSKTKGVSILLAKSFMFHLTDQIIDPEGRFLFLKGTWKDRPVTLANVYCPNSNRVPFLKNTLLQQASFQMGLMILEGDFIVALDPLLDTSTDTSSFPYSGLCQVKLHLASLTLHDTWCTLNPREKDYTFYSVPHNRYSRLDYIFIHQADLSYLADATIENMVLSDHHPITMTLQFLQREGFTKMWRSDASILADPGDAENIRQTLREYFHHNDTPDVAPMTQWEAHK